MISYQKHGESEALQNGREFYINAIFKGDRKAYQEERLERVKKNFNFNYGVFSRYFHKNPEAEFERLRSMIGIVEELARESANGSYYLIGKESLEATISDFEKKIGECARKANHDYSPISKKASKGEYASADSCLEEKIRLEEKTSFWSMLGLGKQQKLEPVAGEGSYWEAYKESIFRENGDKIRADQVSDLENHVNNFNSQYRNLLKHPINPEIQLRGLVRVSEKVTTRYVDGCYDSVESKAVLSVIGDFERKTEELAERFGYTYEKPISASIIAGDAISGLVSEIPGTQGRHRKPVSADGRIVKKGLFDNVKGFFGIK